MRVAAGIWALWMLAGCALPDDFMKAGASVGGGGAGGGGGDAGSGGIVEPDPAPSCPESDPAAEACGPGESCCTTLAVHGGDFDRGFDGETPYDTAGNTASVANFYLDKYEVTVARFRHFLEAADQGYVPSAGEGAHPAHPQSGWSDDYNSRLVLGVSAFTTAVDTACDDAFAVWTGDAPGAPLAESRSMNCLSWYMAFAFCVWDGGRLPTSAEWNYAASGGAEQRKYPWGPDAPTPARAVYDCMDAAACPAPAGTKYPDDAGFYDHADLAGNVLEWTRDTYQTHESDHTPITPPRGYTNPCDNCIDLFEPGMLNNEENHGMTHGGVFFADMVVSLRASNRGSIHTGDNGTWDYGAGVRCARNATR